MAETKTSFIDKHGVDVKRIDPTIGEIVKETVSEDGRIDVEALLDSMNEKFSKEELAIIAADGVVTKLALMSAGVGVTNNQNISDDDRN